MQNFDFNEALKAIQSVKPITGSDGVLAPLIKQLTEAALSAEIDSYLEQVTEKVYSVAEVATRLGTTTHSLYAWIKRYDQGQSKATKDKDSTAELARLRKELQRVTEERDILNEEG